MPPLVVHVVYRLAVGGMENGIVNLINHMPSDRYRHAIICLTDYSEFRNRIMTPEVKVVALRKKAGHDLLSYVRFWRALQDLSPAIVHTRNLAAIEYQFMSAAAGVPARVHGEHGRDVYDLSGSNRRYRLLRRLVNPFIHHYTAVSDDLSRWLRVSIGVDRECVTQIYNGVDTVRFRPRTGSRAEIGPPGFASAGTVVIGTVGRMQAVKDQLTLVRAYLHLLKQDPGMHKRVRLVLIGDGPLRKEAMTLVQMAGADALAWIPGERDDIPELIRQFDIFVLPSLAEGTSNTLLEAMAAGLPIVATRVGGTPEIVEEGQTGLLVPPSDPAAMAQAIRTYVDIPALLLAHGQAGRRRVEQSFSMQSMVQGYLQVYDSLLRRVRYPLFSEVQPASASKRGVRRLFSPPECRVRD